ncbi:MULTISPECIES: DUF2953 domain-containing protein [Pontibacillus]|uniref:DUF2953 domain-containing protein n=1 Tax=Pontibacillus chungwhensis TaxID=265426 RepID=A0ABY8UVN1_9BACI|nr:MULTISPECIES: DUF2953 domain-containing protein [Pontibacillus]MCD5323867.1 DUF2953 domain-containing protein [Pontibacillus sp. HN14]WIF97228.1 DUF2953 domain-containing protein [Pontibacillus chungwhensis]
MVWVLAVVLFFLVNIIIVWFSRLYITLTYLHSSDRDFLKLELRIWKWVRIKKEVPMMALDKEDLSLKTKEKTEVGNKNEGEQEKSYTPEEILNRFQSIQDLVGSVIGLHKIVRRFLRKVRVHTLLWDTQVGTSNASMTGMICGGIWSVKGALIGMVSNYMVLKASPEIYVTPYFQQKHSQTRLECMISFRFGQAIFAVLQVVRYSRGNIPKWRKKPA